MQKDILDFLSEFAVFLQDHKFAVSESALAHLLRLVESAGVDITEEDEMLAALSVCLAKTGEQKNWTYLCLTLKNSWRI